MPLFLLWKAFGKENHGAENLTPEEIGLVYQNHMIRDFPPEERKPLQSIQALVRRGIYTGIGWFDGGKLKGYAFLADIHGPAVLLDYFAVCPDGRGQGAGSRLLAEMAQGYAPRGILIEAEDPDSAPDKELAQKRLRFYNRCGARDSGWKGLIFDVWYRLFCLGGNLSGEETREASLQIYQAMLPPEFFPQKVAYFPVK